MHRSGKSIIAFASVKLECKIVIFIEILLFTNVQHSVYSVAVGSTVHSTETAVTKVFNDLLMAVDRGGGRCLFSASLIYQLALILWTATCCCNDLSVSSACVARRSSGSVHICQAGRPFRVVYGDVMSFIVYVMCSVPQGSVLGPLFFILYMAHGPCGPGCQVRRVSSCLC